MVEHLCGPVSQCAGYDWQSELRPPDLTGNKEVSGIQIQNSKCIVHHTHPLYDTEEENRIVPVSRSNISTARKSIGNSGRDIIRVPDYVICLVVDCIRVVPALGSMISSRVSLI